MEIAEIFAAVDIESIEAVVDLVVKIANAPIVLVLRGQRESLTIYVKASGRVGSVP